VTFSIYTVSFANNAKEHSEIESNNVLIIEHPFSILLTSGFAQMTG